MKIDFYITKNPMRVKLYKEVEFGHGYSILKSSRSLRENNDFFLDLALDYDGYGYMSQQLGKELDSFYLDDEYCVGIHRTGYTRVDDKLIESVFNRGLINNGHSMQGANCGYFDIESTVSLFSDITTLCGQIKATNKYKNSDGCFIIKIPKSYLGEKEGDVKPIFYRDGMNVKLLPEYIYGFIPVKEKGFVGEIIRNPKYKDKHVIENDNLFYDESVADSYKAQSRNDSITLETKYSIIEKAYKDTLLKYNEYQAKTALLHLINENAVQYFSGTENRKLLEKYVIYDNILGILSINNPNNKDKESIINEFVNSNNLMDDVKLK